MKKKQYEKALSYLQTAIGLSGTDDCREEDGQGKYQRIKHVMKYVG
jgi:hypothetical protein